MTVSATFDPSKSRYRVTGSGLTGSTATLYHRQTGSSTWSEVRGATSIPITSGETPRLLDYEFPLGSPAVGGVDYRLDVDGVTHGTVTDAQGSIAGQAWLKFVGFPFLNTPIDVIGASPLSRSGRGATLPVAARMLPVAMTEFMSALSLDLTVMTATFAASRELDEALSMGAIVFLHADEEDLGVPNMYAQVTGVSVSFPKAHHSGVRYTELSLEQVAKPDAAYAGALSTYQSVLSSYATYGDVLAAHPSYSILLELEGTPADVIVS